jgi:hypothetical protein
MRRILIISFSELKSDPRVYRQIQLLRQHFHVTAAGFGNCPAEDIDWIQIQPSLRTPWDQLKNIVLLGLRQFEKSYWNRPLHRIALELLGELKFDLILANDIDALPMAVRLAVGKPVLLDAHEYAPREYEDNSLWRLLVQPYKKYLCREYLGRAQGMLTVCAGLAKEYRRVYGVRPMVVLNAPPYQKLEPTPVDITVVRMIHHGAAISSRHLEVMIEMMQFLEPRFRLDFMLVPSDPAYLKQLRSLAAIDSRIRFVDPVPMLDIPRFTNAYDIGIFLLPPVNFNYAHALPNKFFEFVQARLAVAIGPSPEMARLVEQYAFGVVADDFTPRCMAERLNRLTAQEIAGLKMASDIAARDLCFDRSSEVLLSEVHRLLG